LRSMQKRSAGMRGWFGAGCAVALICACASPRAALAQAADSAGSATSKASGDAAKPETRSNAAAATHKSSTKRSSSRKKGKKKATARGQQKIDPQRAQEIQEALIPLSGGSWLAIENSARCACADQPGAGPEPRPSAESGKCDDHGAGDARVVIESGVAQR
jgi:hypothetical protein